MNFGLLLIRLVVGLLFAGHGAQKLFGVFGGDGLEGTEKMVGSLGYRPARPMALANGFAELLGGTLIALGLWVPFAAAAIIGVMINAIGSVHARNGLWVQNGGFEYPLVNIVVAVALAYTGPGAISLGNAIGTPMGGIGWALFAFFGGAAAGIFFLALRRPKAAQSSQRKAA